jgi:primosomal protein N' (replication factor Y) (superfamily II helicase)
MNFSGTDYFIDVVLPLALDQLYTYSVPSHLKEKIQPGQRVIVQFGKQKMYTALVYSVHNRTPHAYRPKEIIEQIDEEPVVTAMQFKLWEWISEYYLCSLGEILNAALPAVMKLQSETAVMLHEGFTEDRMVLTAEESWLVNELSGGKSLKISEITKKTGIKNSLKFARSMMERGILIPHEEMKERFIPRQVAYVKLTKLAEEEDFMQQLFVSLEKKAPKQLQLLMTFMRLKSEKGKDYISKPVLIKSAGVTSSILQQLIVKGVFEIFADTRGVFSEAPEFLSRQIVLSEVQQQAYEQISDNFKNNKVTLLHGVTSSGKTEVYIKLITDAIGSGKQVLYMLPEIALTTQILGRLKAHFGERLLVYHSRFSNRDRAEVYNKLLVDGKDGVFRYPIIVGARSSLFLPLKNPGLFIVDEEHDNSYKQFDPAPRYNARDCAVMCGHLYSCNVLLGSATPSLESFYNAETGKYELVRMNERYGGMKMPQIKLIDLKEAYRNRQMKSHFSAYMLQQIKTALADGEQVILFQNRRGFAPVIECNKCGWIPHCINCDVTLTYHKKSNQIRCHYCGYTTIPPVKCQACGDPDLRMKGMGTERIEDEISVFFPDNRIQRLDLDTTSSKHSFQRILQEFESGDIDILVGTQMVTKGLDFDNVSLVGVINADHLINFPDFRASERSYQLLAQVSGRSGRKFKQGKVIVQTFQPAHPLLHFLTQNDYVGFYRYEVDERKKYNYPPFVRLIELRLKMKNDKELDELAKEFVKELKMVFGNRVLGPVVPPIARIRNYYIQNVLLKIERSLSDQKVKSMITKVTDRFLSHPENRSLIIHADVDPA